MHNSKSKQQTKLSITQAREASDDLTKHLKVAQRFKEVDALTDEKEIRASLHTHRTEVTRIIDSQDEHKALARAVADTTKLRLAELCAKVPAGVSVRNVARENHIPFVEAERLRIVGTRVDPEIQKFAMYTARKHGRDVSVADLDSLANLTKPQQKQAICKLGDLPTMKDAAVAVAPEVFPEWKPTPPAKAAPAQPAASPVSLEYARLAKELRSTVNTLCNLADAHAIRPSTTSAKRLIDTELKARELFKALVRNTTG
jgi:hypothetical protein